MSDLIKGDGWNLEHSVIKQLMEALGDARHLEEQVSKYTVASTFGDAETLAYELDGVVEALEIAHECLFMHIADYQFTQRNTQRTK